ncbi:MAG TPA: YebC/PmpR family DNA-binding transcriptional regulator [Elusimicrobia bacterium]|nr:YebC/PmpR family DNA-binding transcriptional regulator [Elusimicrobiota bacterium]
MGGHSHWAGIKHKKAITDAKRGKVWTRIVREITMAAKMGGGKPADNPRLRKAVDDARAANMPAENVKRAIQKGTGELPGANYEELTFEGYAPGGVAVFAEGTTDNRNRSTNEIRKIFEDHGGNMGQAGCVAFQFEKKGTLSVPKSKTTEEALMELALELGADDIKSEDADVFEVFTPPQALQAVADGLKAKGLPVESPEVAMVPKSTVPVASEETARKILELMEGLEAHDDVSNVYANFDIPDTILAAIEK